VCVRKMHADELDIDPALVARLLAVQFPRWARLPIAPVDSAGTDNAIYRLGDELAVRLPRRPSTAGQPAKEFRWLPRLAPLLPLAIPVPLVLGEPGEGFPWQWSICRWLPGEAASAAPIADLSQAAIALAQFVKALQGIDAGDGPPPGAHNFGRGVPLATRDAATREAIVRLASELDAAAVTAAWERALRAPAWDGPPRWIHGDLLPGNLLVEDGRLSGVIDFGCLGAGDPACDLLCAWTLFSGASREAFRVAMAVDEAGWERGRGWALSTALIAVPYYRETNPELANIGRRTIAAVLADGEPDA
jgi:aminoglycoside phosphotransferase (APT) family kinase protein